MPKNKKIDLNKIVMSQITSGKIRPLPRWYFVLGSILSIFGLVGLTIFAIFVTNLLFFISRAHGPMFSLRLSQIVSSFPWWLVLLAPVSIFAGIFLLKKYDFSYQKNFRLIVFLFILSVILSAWLMDYFGLNETLLRQNKMRKFYQYLNTSQTYPQRLYKNRL